MGIIGERRGRGRDITYPFWEELATDDCSTSRNFSPQWNTYCRVHAQGLLDDGLQVMHLLHSLEGRLRRETNTVNLLSDPLKHTRASI